MRKDQKIIVGIDEAGRGPLAGPMVIAAVAVVKSDRWRVISAGIKDSKKLSPRKREFWYNKLCSSPSIVSASASVAHGVIDHIGISRAARLAVSRCLRKISQHTALNTHQFHVLLDGGLFAPREYSQKTIIRGDEKVALISAASIVAKVTRDRLMVRCSKKYPEYCFEIHKGYGTRAHFASIKKYGLSPVHRKSFCKFYVSKKQDARG